MHSCVRNRSLCRAPRHGSRFTLFPPPAAFPEGAARFALLTVGLVLRGIVLTDQAPPGFLLGEDVSVEEELTRMVLGYLGVDGGSGGAS